MKSIALLFAAVLVTTTSAWAVSPAQLDYKQLTEIIRIADGNTYAANGVIGASITADLRPIHPYFYAAGDKHGPVFICQSGFEDFTGGPVKATLAHYQLSEDDPDVFMLFGCTAQER